MKPAEFAKRLDLALKAVSFSRGQLAAELGIDKSLVSRWMSGANVPSSHNLARLTQFIAGRSAGFNMLDWDLSLPALAARLGVKSASGTVSAAGPADRPHPSVSDVRVEDIRLIDWIPRVILEEAVVTTRLRGAGYEGFWKSTRPANSPRGAFLHDQIMISPGPNGLLRFRLAVIDMSFEGWILPIQTQLVTVAADPRTGVFLFGVFNAVLRDRPEVMDGLTLTWQRFQGGIPVAAGCMIERQGDLSYDLAIDEARFAELARQNPVAPDGSIPPEVRDRLYHDVGPTAFAAGGDSLLAMAFASSIGRGRGGLPPSGSR